MRVVTYLYAGSLILLIAAVVVANTVSAGAGLLGVSLASLGATLLTVGVMLQPTTASLAEDGVGPLLGGLVCASIVFGLAAWLTGNQMLVDHSLAHHPLNHLTTSLANACVDWSPGATTVLIAFLGARFVRVMQRPAADGPLAITPAILPPGDVDPLLELRKLSIQLELSEQASEVDWSAIGCVAARLHGLALVSTQLPPRATESRLTIAADG